MTRNTERLRRGLEDPRRIPSHLLGKLGTSVLMEQRAFYRAWLKLKGASLSPEIPDLSAADGELQLKTLQTRGEYRRAVDEVRSLGLHPHQDLPKNWDALSALKTILGQTDPRSRILDAGGDRSSPLIEWLYLYGYEDLHVQNIDFDEGFRRDVIRYQEADFTRSGFAASSVDAITCLSVIEHGVDIDTALEEFHRILSPGGLLIISTDYWPDKKDTRGKGTEFGGSRQTWEIFDREEIGNVLGTSESVGFRTPEEPDLSVDEETVEWKDESYTFIYFELEKR